jgi:hypothetical protein
VPRHNRLPVEGQHIGHIAAGGDIGKGFRASLPFLERVLRGVGAWYLFCQLMRFIEYALGGLYFVDVYNDYLFGHNFHNL